MDNKGITHKNPPPFANLFRIDPYEAMSVRQSITDSSDPDDLEALWEQLGNAELEVVHTIHVLEDRMKELGHEWNKD